MHSPFLPNPGFAWVFFLSVSTVLIVASYFDLRYLTIPKPLTIGTLALGFVMNLVGGVWCGLLKETTFDTFHAFMGGIDGVIFSVCGFLMGFGIFLFLWLMGLCGGGDVKLFAAVATWLGWYYSFWLWFGSVIALVLMATTRLVIHTLFSGPASTRKVFFRSTSTTNKTGNSSRPKQRLLPYSLPLTVAAAIMLLWFFRVELNLAERPVPNASGAALLGPPRGAPQ